MQDNDAPLLIAKGIYRCDIGKQEGIHYMIGEIHKHEKSWFWKTKMVAHMLDRVIEMTQELPNLEKRRVYFSTESFPMGTHIDGEMPKFTDVTGAVINYKSR